jgi:hexosaminidase
MKLNLLPCPRSLKLIGGALTLPKGAGVQALACSEHTLKRELQPKSHLRKWLHIQRSNSAPDHPEGYELTISKDGIRILFRETGGLRAARATLRQIIRQCSGAGFQPANCRAGMPAPLELPCLKIRDWPDFARRGVMLDVSRGRVPKLETLLELVEHLADFKINELQLYIEHTFAYRNYKPVWRSWGALTAVEIRKLDVRCRELGIDLVPNQNSFGHLRYFLEHPPLKKLAEVSEPYESGGGEFLRYPSTLAPNYPGSIRFLRGLYGELLPNFTSRFFNVGCDETWDLGRGQSRLLCKRKGKGRVYLDFLKKIHREVSKRKRRMMFWGDIVLHHPELIPKLPKDLIALNWGYEADHPYNHEARLFEKSGIPFYVCPGTSTWMTLIGKHDNALANLRSAARAGSRHGAIGYLITDWGDGGHPQPLAVSYLPYLAGAALSWCAKSFDERLLVPVLSRDIFHDRTQRLARAALGLGLAHRKFGYVEPNSTPFGTVLAAPPPETRELFCRNGLKLYTRIANRNLRAALREVERLRATIQRARPETDLGKMLTLELDLAARMAAQSCEIALWHQALAVGRTTWSRGLAERGIRNLKDLEKDFKTYWPLQNKGSTRHCSAFLRWRIQDYQSGALPHAAWKSKT